MILALIPMCILNILQLVALGFSSILIVDTILQILSVGIEVLAIAVEDDEIMPIFVFAFRLAIFFFRLDAMKTGLRNTYRIPKIKKILKTNDFDKIMNCLIKYCYGSEWPL